LPRFGVTLRSWRNITNVEDGGVSVAGGIEWEQSVLFPGSWTESERRDRVIYSVVRLIWNQHSNVPSILYCASLVEADKSPKVVECKYARARAPRVVVVCVVIDGGIGIVDSDDFKVLLDNLTLFTHISHVKASDIIGIPVIERYVNRML